jgi:replicative DNA helicase
MIDAKIQPQAIDLEEMIIGAIMLEADAYERITDLINEDTFYLDAHKRIFKSFKNIKENNQSIDFLTVSDDLKKNGNLEKVGGNYFVVGLTNKVASSANIEQHARIIKEKELRREMILICNKAMNSAYNDTVDIFDNVIDVSLKTAKLLEVGSSKKLDKLNDVIIFNHKDRLIEKTGEKSKFKEIPDFQKGKLYIIAGRPAMGKTTYAINEAYNFSKSSNVLMISLEMSSSEIVTKIESLESRIPSFRIEKNKIYKNEEQKYDKLKLLNTNFYIDDTAEVTLMHIKTKATKLKNDEGLGMIVIDYLQLMTGNTKGNREQEISSITRGLKKLAKSLDIPVIALSQLSRAVESRQNKRPMLSDLRESGSIEQDADVVSFLFRPYYYAELSGDKELMNATDKNLAEVITAKNRGGQVKTTELSCDLSISEFTDKKEFLTDGEFIQEEAPF